jgi:hypothetical protein
LIYNGSSPQRDDPVLKREIKIDPPFFLCYLNSTPLELEIHNSGGGHYNLNLLPYVGSAITVPMKSVIDQIYHISNKMLCRALD